MNETRLPGFGTLCIHAGQEPEPVTGAVSVPIFQTSTYAQDALGTPRAGFEYARSKNPTRLALEELLASLEGGAAGHAFASGQAATSTLATAHLRSGDHVVVSRCSYGGTWRYFTKVLANFGVAFSWVDTTDLDAVRAAIGPATRMLFVETPANPTMEISDLAALATLAGEASARAGAKVRLVIDNTFATPFFQRPLALGADAVVHSTTKYLNGHSDSIGGAIVSATAEDGARIAFVQNAAGAILSPFDSFLVTRGIKTLAVRMRAHDENGRAVAAFLAVHPAVKRVFYPGLPSHPQHALASRQMSGFGGMVSFDLGSPEAVPAFFGRLKLCTIAESLGGVETLVGQPATMSHGSVPPDERAARGITDGLVRLSVGIEDVDDLLADVARALEGE
ncbi:MAG: PLP-dependent transferase [Holophagales bacterium]|jgi:cystathionine beta-lyase/cystathionine gamma-synthase|nr:PLP-dependent transferase [Holophagales bacterium]